jgi:hypothetical protein
MCGMVLCLVAGFRFPYPYLRQWLGAPRSVLSSLPVFGLSRSPLSGFVSLVWVTIFIHLVICLTTGPQPLPKWAVHVVGSTASSFKWEYPLLSLRSSSNFLRLLPRLLSSPFTRIFPSITLCRRQFLRKMWPIQLAFRFLNSCRIFFCSLTLSNRN